MVLPKRKAELINHTFIDYVEDLVAIQPVHWLLDVLEQATSHLDRPACTPSKMRLPPGPASVCYRCFSAKSNSKLIPIMTEEIKVYRDVFLSIHEDIESLTRVKSVSRHMVSVFNRDKKFLNEF